MAEVWLKEEDVQIFSFLNTAIISLSLTQNLLFSSGMRLRIHPLLRQPCFCQNPQSCSNVFDFPFTVGTCGEGYFRPLRLVLCRPITLDMALLNIRTVGKTFSINETSVFAFGSFL